MYCGPEALLIMSGGIIIIIIFFFLPSIALPTDEVPVNWPERSDVILPAELQGQRCVKKGRLV